VRELPTIKRIRLVSTDIVKSENLGYSSATLKESFDGTFNTLIRHIISLLEVINY